MRPLLFLFISLSLILCLLSVTTNYWYEHIQEQYNSGLFKKCLRSSEMMFPRICYTLSYTHSRGLAISSLIFLSISLFLIILSGIKSQNRLLAYITVLFLLISSLLLLFSYILYPKEKQNLRIGHSTYLMLVSCLLTFLSTILSIFVAQTIS